MAVWFLSSSKEEILIGLAPKLDFLIKIDIRFVQVLCICFSFTRHIILHL